MVSETKEKNPLPSITYNKDGTIKHVVHLSEPDGRKYVVERVINLGRDPEECQAAIAERKKKWKPFGAAADPTIKTELKVYSENFDLPFKLYTNPQELELADQIPEKKETTSTETNIRCRVCEGFHWTSACPQKGLKKVEEAVEEKDKKEDLNKYIPPSRRSDRPPSDELPSIRIANLSEETTDQDLKNLVRRFGEVARMYLAKHDDGRCKGFAFVNFTEPEAAEAAIAKLNGYGYANLILSCEIAKKRER